MVKRVKWKVQSMPPKTTTINFNFQDQEVLETATKFTTKKFVEMQKKENIRQLYDLQRQLFCSMIQ